MGAAPAAREAVAEDDAALARRCTGLVERLGLARADDVLSVRPLVGGVSSDVARVTLARPARLPDGNAGPVELCVKFALPTLRVATEWHAPVRRSATEYRWLGFAASVVPGIAPAPYGLSEEDHGFAMAWVENARTWKVELLGGRHLRGPALGLADALGRLHSASAAEGFDPEGFDNADDFHALRVAPYFLHAAGAHPALQPDLEALADELHRARGTLVHGDVSPKNVLLRGELPMLLDAECATLGDAAFDPAFCLNHLVLKALHRPRSRAALLDAAGDFVLTYLARVEHEDRGALDARVARLLPALMLGRVDGKSPLEYLDEAEREAVRRIAAPLVLDPPPSTAALLGTLRTAFAEIAPAPEAVDRD